VLSNVKPIQQFREQLGLTQQELGDRVRVTRQTIAAWEKGERDVSVAQLARLARALNVPLGLLLGTEPEEETTLLFRADDPTVLSVNLRHLLSEKAEDYAAIERLAGELPVLPESRPLQEFEPDLVEDISREVRDWLGVDDAPLGDVLALFEAKGLKIMCHPLPNKVSGFSAYTNAWGGIIVINSRHALERQYFTALHELAHLILHRREYDRPAEPAKRRGDPREKAANHFASAALLPREIMEKELRGFKLGWIPDPVLADMKLKYGVSMRTVLLRAGALGLISKKQAGQQVGVLNKRYGFHDEQPELPRPERKPKSRLERLTYRALIKDEITTSRAAEVLAKPLMEVRERLTEYLTNPANEGARG
jgi:Zn-dependent peptidase ImmA (M78 family)/transcriptional regulator with XRE-family HTH domain